MSQSKSVEDTKPTQMSPISPIGLPNVPEIKYSEEETAYRYNLIRDMCYARDNRNAPQPELDYMSYPQYYDDNKRKDLSFIPPKKNKQDVRIVSGTTREKDSTLLSTFLDLNLTSDITAFDEDNLIINEYGDNMDSLVFKSRQIEEYHKKRPIYYREMIAQGDVFVEELYTEEYKPVPLSELTWDPTKDGISEFSFAERMKRINGKCTTRMVSGKRVYLWNLRCEYIDDQDGVAILNVMPRSEAKIRYGDWERWQYVPYTVNTENLWDDSITYRDWNLFRMQNPDQVAEIRVYLPRINRFMILLNGVMMLPINYPLSAVSPSGKIPMTQGKLEPIPGYAYSKSLPSKTKVDQAVIDEMQTLFVEAMRQQRKPPMGNISKKLVGSDIFNAGKITPNMKEGQLFPLLPQGSYGIQPSEFSFFKMMKDQIDEKTTNSAYGGQTPQGDPTATEVNRVQAQQVLKLSHHIDGLMNFESTMVWHRIHNIIAKWFTPYDTKLDTTRNGIIELYNNITVSADMPNGEPGIKLFRLTTDDYPDPQEQEQEEYDLAKTTGKEHRIVYMDPKIVTNLKCLWYVQMKAEPKNDDRLATMIFVQNVEKSMQLFGPQAHNMEYLKKRYAVKIGENYNKFYAKMDIMDMLKNGTNPDGSMSTGGGGQKVALQGGENGLKPIVK